MKKPLLNILLFLFVMPLPAFAWDDTGHKVVSYIAWQQMSPTARERAARILAAANEDSDLGVFLASDSRSLGARQLEHFLIASTWSDIIRNRDYKFRFRKFHRGPWHYLDTFWKETDGRVEIISDMKSDKENAVERLFAFDKLLRDPAATDVDKATALAWVLHLAGDIHQPLHCSARITEFEPKGDQGGNLFELMPKETPRENRVSLHWYWDQLLTKNLPRENDECDQEYIPFAAAKITKKYPRAKMESRLKAGKFDEWQREGFQLASTKVYSVGLKRNEMPGTAYKKAAFGIASEQIALAGYRLGVMLEQIFSQPTSPIAQPTPNGN